jgi:hypothetical protein
MTLSHRVILNIKWDREDSGAHSTVTSIITEIWNGFHWSMLELSGLFVVISHGQVREDSEKQHK